MKEVKKQIINRLLEIQSVCFGEFTLKSGIISPLYIDLRPVISYPDIMNLIVQMWQNMCQDIGYDRVVGIPYTALPLATAFSLQVNKPLLYARKEQKTYGRKKQIEGVYKSGETVLLLDDLITTGETKKESLVIYGQAGLKIKDIVVVVDREQGATQLLESQGYTLHSGISVYEILEQALITQYISKERYEEVCLFLKTTSCS